MQIASSAVETNTESASACEYTAAVAMLNRRQVRITLHAISPRFAMSILLKCAPLRLAPFILCRCRKGEGSLLLYNNTTRDLPSSRQITFSGNKDKAANCDRRAKAVEWRTT